MIVILLIAFNIIIKINSVVGYSQTIETECPGQSDQILRTKIDKCITFDCRQIHKHEVLRVTQEIEFREDKQNIKVELENREVQIILKDVSFKCLEPKKRSFKPFTCVSHKRFMSSDETGGVEISVGIPSDLQSGLYSLRVIYDCNDFSSPCIASQVVEILDSKDYFLQERDNEKSTEVVNTIFEGRAVDEKKENSEADNEVDNYLEFVISKLKDMEITNIKIDVLKALALKRGGVILHEGIVRGIESIRRSKPTMVKQISPGINETTFTFEIKNIEKLINGSLFLNRYKLNLFLKSELKHGEFEVKMENDGYSGDVVKSVKILKFEGLNLIIKTGFKQVDLIINKALNLVKGLLEPLVKMATEKILVYGINQTFYIKKMYSVFYNLFG